MTNKRAATWVELRAWVLALAALGTAAACAQTHTTESGETHFLLTCGDESCAQGFECLCGACSRACDDDTACSDLGTTVSCVEHDANQCRTVTKSCDASCDADAACHSLGKGYTCRAGLCRAGAALPEPAACAGGCGDAECAAPGACSLATACSVVDCGGVLVDDNACFRPACESDGDCPSDERCASLWLSHHTACGESNGACECTAGLGLFPVHLCSPVRLAGPRGAWVSLKLRRADRVTTTEYTIYPDGRVERTSIMGAAAPTTTASQLDENDRDELERSVNGPTLRSALASDSDCGMVGDLSAQVTLELDTTTLEKSVAGCLNAASPYDELFTLAERY
jgi:hypothetical protein